MIEAHEIIKQVQEKFKGLPDKMARLFVRSRRKIKEAELRTD